MLMALFVPLSTNAVATFILTFLLGIAGMGIPPVGTGLAVRFAHAAPTLAAAISVSVFNGGTAIGTWLGAWALESTLGVVGPLTTALTSKQTFATIVGNRYLALPAGSSFEGVTARRSSAGREDVRR